MKKEIVENQIEIANRVIGKGDTWEVVGVKKQQPSITDALEAYFQNTSLKPIAFRLNLAGGKLYAIFTSEQEIEEPKPKKYSIYGDYEI